MVTPVSSNPGASVLALLPVSADRPVVREEIAQVVRRPDEALTRPFGGPEDRRSGRRILQAGGGGPHQGRGKGPPQSPGGVFADNPVSTESPAIFQETLAKRAPAVFGDALDNADRGAALRSMQSLFTGLDQDAARGNFLDLFA